MPLYHFVTNDLPSSTKAPELEDVHAKTALEADARASGESPDTRLGVTKELVAKYLGYLVAVGFLQASTGKTADPLPLVKIGSEQREALGNVGGRGGLI